MGRLRTSGACSASIYCLVSLAAVQTNLVSPAARAEPGTFSARRAYQIDRAHSRVTVETHTSGLLAPSSRAHLVAARDFRGQVSFVRDALETTVVDFVVRADSLTILDEMSEPSRRDIDLAIRRTLDAGRYPRIAFHSASATANPVGPYIYDVTASGTLELHGVRRPLILSAQVAVEGDKLRIRGACTLRQTDYGIVPFSLGKATIEVADQVTLTFDLEATAPPLRR